MPRNHQHRVEGVGGRGAVALAMRAALVSQPSLGTSAVCLLVSTAHIDNQTSAILKDKY